ncbi:MAG TPA: hypothetical protein VGN12_22640 [Pirellulales bacterium]|jgi:hypothetical protein
MKSNPQSSGSRTRGIFRGAGLLPIIALLFIHSQFARAQSSVAPDAMRRLPPLTSVTTSSRRTSPADVVRATSPHSALPGITVGQVQTFPRGSAAQGIQPYSTVANHTGGDIQLTSALVAPAASVVPMRRLPPLTTVFSASSRGPARPGLPAHISREAPGSRSPTAVARVLPGSLAISGRAVYLGVPPQPATSAGDLSAVGLSTLHPGGLMPKMQPSPISQMPPR